LESAFARFGGVTEEVLIDNPRALVAEHDARTRSVVFNQKFLAFAKHWGVRPRACAPYRARTKGKTENGVGYVKKNAIAGRSFASWQAFEAHLDAWTREVADERVHGTTGEAPIARFGRAEASALKPIAGIAPFRSTRELITGRLARNARLRSMAMPIRCPGGSSARVCLQRSLMRACASIMPGAKWLCTRR
jgi:hypothetical protein